MSNDKMNLAKQTFATVCKALEDLNLKFERRDDDLFANFIMNGDDLPMDIIIAVDADRELVRLLSFMPFNMAEDKRVEGAVITSVANLGMQDGLFVYDLSDGSIMYKLVSSYKHGTIGKDLIEYMIALGCAMIEQYNDRFFAVNKGFMSLQDFIAKES